jgi:hypothetical protein
LNSAEKLIALAFNSIQLVVRQLAPFLFYFAANLFPLPFHSIPVHRSSPFLKSWRQAAQLSMLMWASRLLLQGASKLHTG